MSLFGLEFEALKALLIEWEWSCIITQCVWFVFPAIKSTFQATRSTFGRSILIFTFHFRKSNFEIESYYYSHINNQR